MAVELTKTPAPACMLQAAPGWGRTSEPRLRCREAAAASTSSAALPATMARQTGRDHWQLPPKTMAVASRTQEGSSRHRLWDHSPTETDTLRRRRRDPWACQCQWWALHVPEAGQRTRTVTPSAAGCQDTRQFDRCHTNHRTDAAPHCLSAPLSDSSASQCKGKDLIGNHAACVQWYSLGVTRHMDACRMGLVGDTRLGTGTWMQHTLQLGRLQSTKKCFKTLREWQNAH
jgi:hypothetical protein